MKSVIIFLCICCAPLLLVGGCTDSLVAPQQSDQSVTVVVSEYFCLYSYGGYETRCGVRADLWFESMQDGTLYWYHFDSSGPETIDLPFGDYHVFMKSGRGYELTAFQQIVRHSDSGLYVIHPDSLPEYYWLGPDMLADTLLVRHEAAFGPDTITFEFTYDGPDDSSGVASELKLLNQLDLRIGGYITLIPDSRRVKPSGIGTKFYVKYDAVVQKPVYLFEAVNALKVEIGEDNRLHVRPKYASAC